VRTDSVSADARQTPRLDQQVAFVELGNELGPERVKSSDGHGQASADRSR
jgi:hypothetical protein